TMCANHRLTSGSDSCVAHRNDGRSISWIPKTKMAARGGRKRNNPAEAGLKVQRKGLSWSVDSD
ncbi:MULTISPECIES: hypothetical protein, partial [unclassified Burkholderia]|uniref:hypothetical protein n=1 Tax=unclassified Burkholderia TaxID=2613784 RepID=UPI001C54DD23